LEKEGLGEIEVPLLEKEGLGKIDLFSVDNPSGLGYA
jgi:hypothetical protein